MQEKIDAIKAYLEEHPDYFDDKNNTTNTINDVIDFKVHFPHHISFVEDLVLATLAPNEISIGLVGQYKTNIHGGVNICNDLMNLGTVLEGKEVVGYFQIPKEVEEATNYLPDLKTGKEWATAEDITVADPKGWAETGHDKFKEFEQVMITKEEFYRKLENSEYLRNPEPEEA